MPETEPKKTYSGQGVICPYCGHVERGEDLYDYKDDDKTTETECPACEKPYTVTVVVSRTYIAEAIR